MQKTPTLRTVLLVGGALLALCRPARADFNPIDLTPGSFTADVIVEKTAIRPFSSYTTATMDGGTNNTGQTWYERGFDAFRPTTGIPPAGATFTAEADANRSFKMPPSYTDANNALVVYSQLSGSLAVSTPAAFTTLSVLSGSAGGAATVNYTIHYAGGGTQAGTLGVLDWFNNTPIAVTANGRVNTDNGRIGDTYSGNPRLTYGDIGLTDTVNAVTSIDFTSTSGNRAAIFAVSGSTDGTTFTPVDVTGFNRDIVIESSVIPSGCLYSKVTVTMDGGSTNRTGNTFYERGFNTNFGATATGLPVAGSTVTDGFHSFTMPPTYTTNNAIYVGNYEGYQVGNLALTTPAAFTGLSFLSAAGNGPVSIDVTVAHDDGTSEVVNFASLDWFNGSQSFYSLGGRFQPDTLGLNNINQADGNPRISTNDVVLANTTSPVTNLTFTFLTGGRAAIFAVAGQATAGGVFSPVAVTGYNADVVAEASASRLPAACNATTASMDGGVNNTGNSWYEQGYYSYVPSSGLPAPGTIITSIAQPDHHYKMPASYTANNAVFVDSVRSNANLTIATPATYSALSFLSATANNNVTNQCIMQYQDGTMETNTFVSRDWFNNSPYAFTALGRVNVENRSINNTVASTATPNPRLYEAQFALGNTVSPLTNILLRFLGAINPTTGRMVVMAVSASAGSFSPIVTTVSPSPAGAYEGGNLTLQGNVSGGTEPITYRWQYSPSGAGTFADLSNGGIISGATTTNLTFTGITKAQIGDYRLVATNAAGFGISSVGNVNVLTSLQDVTRPGDAITRINGTTGGGGTEGEPNAINDNTSKYLNFDDLDTAAPFVGPVGFVVSPSLGQTVPSGVPTIVQGVRIYTANDGEERDPIDVTIEGADDYSSWVLISSNSLALPSARNAAALALNPFTQASAEVLFANTTNYLNYRVTFNNVKNNTTANSMQLAEIELLGTFALPPVAITADGTGNLTINFSGSGTLLSTTNIANPVWVEEGAISGSTVITPAPGEPQKFYRVRVP